MSQLHRSIGIILDLDIQIINDFESESIEINEMNSWLTYGEPLHRARELALAISGVQVRFVKILLIYANQERWRRSPRLPLKRK